MKWIKSLFIYKIFDIFRMKNYLFRNACLAPQNREEELQSLTINFLRFPLAILVVYIHVNPQNSALFTPIQAINLYELNTNNLYSIIARLGSHFCSIAVPFFFFTSGYYFFFKTKKWSFTTYTKKIKKRIRTLLIPYIIWNLLAFFFLIASKLGGIILLSKPWNELSTLLSSYDTIWSWLEIFWNKTTWREESTNIFGMSTQMWGPQLLPLWFLRDLIIITALTPLIYFFIRHLKVYFIILLGIGYVLTICTLPGLSITGIFFFSFGAYLSINNRNLIQFFEKQKKLYWVAAPLFLVLCVVFDAKSYTRIFDALYCISALGLLFCTTSTLLKSKQFHIYPNLANTSFFIYALHSMGIFKFSIISFVCYITNKLFNAEEYAIGAILRYLISPIIVVIICLTIFLFLKKYFPVLLNLLTGNRN